jgi:hypothetical protein
MTQLTALIEASPAAEQRATVRRRKLAPIDVLAAKKGHKPFRGWVVDHSLGGFRLLLPRKFAIDHLICIRPPNASESIPWLQLQIKSCQPKDEQWEVGCALQSSPSYSVLLSYW